jgi:hypothetical protein
MKIEQLVGRLQLGEKEARRNRRRVLAAGVVIFIILIAGISFLAWKNNGSLPFFNHHSQPQTIQSGVYRLLLALVLAISHS